LSQTRTVRHFEVFYYTDPTKLQE